MTGILSVVIVHCDSYYHKWVPEHYSMIGVTKEQNLNAALFK